jgi:DNA processing protein
VVEAGEKSGALLTAEHALEQGREVFAVPGNITSKTSSGTNRIIKEGAKLVTCAEDVLEELKFIIPIKKSREPEQVAELSDDRRQVYDLLSDEPQHIDKIVKKANISVSQTLEIMLDLELTGLVEQLSGKMFVKRF